MRYEKKRNAKERERERKRGCLIYITELKTTKYTTSLKKIHFITSRKFLGKSGNSKIVFTRHTESLFLFQKRTFLIKFPNGTSLSPRITLRKLCVSSPISSSHISGTGEILGPKFYRIPTSGETGFRRGSGLSVKETGPLRIRAHDRSTVIPYLKEDAMQRHYIHM